MRRWLLLSVLVCLATSVYGQQPNDVISPNVFLRGIPVAEGIRYTATLIKPTDEDALRNLSVEITLPADAELVEMLVPRQVEFDVIRRDRQRRLTLIWQISRVASTTYLDTFSFTLAQPLTTTAEFYAQYLDEAGTLQINNFLEVPVVVSDRVQMFSDDAIAADTLQATLLTGDFNPPASNGDFWWCSLVQLDGLAPEQTARVIVPLRRPIAPFTELVLFQQQGEEWVPLADTGLVTADGQFVVYNHPGGVVATGGEPEIQPVVIPATQLVVLEVTGVLLPLAPGGNNPAPTAAPVQSNNVVPSQPTASTDGNVPQPPVVVVPSQPTPVVVVPSQPTPAVVVPSQPTPVVVVPSQPTPAVVVPSQSTPVVVVPSQPTPAVVVPSQPTSNPTVVLTANVPLTTPVIVIPSQPTNTTGVVPSQPTSNPTVVLTANVPLTTPVIVIPSQPTSTTGVVPSQPTNTTGVVPSQPTNTTGVVPSQPTNTTGVVPSQPTASTGGNVPLPTPVVVVPVQPTPTQISAVPTSPSLLVTGVGTVNTRVVLLVDGDNVSQCSTEGINCVTLLRTPGTRTE